jgi:hypothetical protein
MSYNIIEPEYIVISPLERIYLSHENDKRESFYGSHHTVMAVVPRAGANEETFRDAVKDYPDRVIKELKIACASAKPDRFSRGAMLTEHEKALKDTLTKFGIQEEESARVSEQYMATLYAENDANINKMKLLPAGEAVVREFLQEKIEKVLQNRHYEMYPRMQEIAQKEIAHVADEIGLHGFTDRIEFRIKKYLTDEGGKAYPVNNGKIILYDGVLKALIEDSAIPVQSDEVKARIHANEQELHKTIHEEMIHVIDGLCGVSAKPKWQKFTRNVYNDSVKQAAWAEMNDAREGKQSPGYYMESVKDLHGIDNPSILSAELLVDLLQTEQLKAQELGSRDAARKFLAATFGRQAIDFIDDFNATAKHENAARLKSATASRQEKGSSEPDRSPGRWQIIGKFTAMVLGRGHGQEQGKS